MAAIKTIRDNRDAEFDDHEHLFLEKVDQVGWFATHVFDAEGEEPDFTFTTGYWLNAGFAETIVFGLPKDTAHDVLWDMFNDIEANKKPPIGVSTSSIFANIDAYLFPVAKRHYREYLGQSRWFYDGDDFPCLQLVWPDADGIFPWQSGYDKKHKDVQPDLTEHGWVKALKG